MQSQSVGLMKECFGLSQTLWTTWYKALYGTTYLVSGEHQNLFASPRLIIKHELRCQ